MLASAYIARHVTHKPVVPISHYITVMKFCLAPALRVFFLATSCITRCWAAPPSVYQCNDPDAMLCTCRQSRGKYSLDGTRIGNLGRYLNHSCNVRSCTFTPISWHPRFRAVGQLSPIPCGLISPSEKS